MILQLKYNSETRDFSNNSENNLELKDSTYALKESIKGAYDKSVENIKKAYGASKEGVKKAYGASKEGVKKAYGASKKELLKNDALRIGVEATAGATINTLTMIRRAKKLAARVYTKGTPEYKKLVASILIKAGVRGSILATLLGETFTAGHKLKEEVKKNTRLESELKNQKEINLEQGLNLAEEIKAHKADVEKHKQNAEDWRNIANGRKPEGVHKWLKSIGIDIKPQSKSKTIIQNPKVINSAYKSNPEDVKNNPLLKKSRASISRVRKEINKRKKQEKENLKVMLADHTESNTNEIGNYLFSDIR